ncbi:MAG TPA: cupin domain-containing protein [Solirubrobacteraceae bacterium]|nr:cupin domain-containing protein [Solirubrobacteraceae bacterium]
MVIHWDDVDGVTTNVGELRGTWRRLGRAAGATGVGANRIDLPPHARSTPVHTHTGEEEIFYVLGGSGLSWQDGRTYAVAAGDCLFHPARGPAHTLIAGDAGMDVIAFGPRQRTETGPLPRAGVTWIGGSWGEFGGGDHPWAREAAAGPLEIPEPEQTRPGSIANIDEVEPFDFGRGDVGAVRRDLGRAVGSQRTGLKHATVLPGKLSSMPHCHASEEEVFLVLDGEGTLLLDDEEHPVRSGSVVARPPGTGVAHTFRAGDEGLTLLCYGTREPGDIRLYPRSGKLSIPGLRATFRVERVDVWDGEE